VLSFFLALIYGKDYSRVPKNYYYASYNIKEREAINPVSRRIIY